MPHDTHQPDPPPDEARQTRRAQAPAAGSQTPGQASAEAELAILRVAAAINDPPAAEPEGPGNGGTTRPASGPDPASAAMAMAIRAANADSPAAAACANCPWARMGRPDGPAPAAGATEGDGDGPAGPRLPPAAAARITIIQGDVVEAGNYYGRILDHPNSPSVRGGSADDLI